MTLTKTEDVVVYRKKGTYNGFPNIVRFSDGRILVVFRQAKDRRAKYGYTTHTDVSGKAVSVCSADSGRTWDAEASEVYDFPLGGMNDTNITLLSDGIVLGVFYRWRSFLASDAGVIYPWDNVQRVGDQTFVWRLDGTYTIRSSDAGRSWDEPVKIVYAETPMEIHSRGKAVQMPDSSLLLPVNGSVPFYRSTPVFSSVVRSTDNGITWEPYADIAKSDDIDFYETTIYRSPGGEMTAFLRGITRPSRHAARSGRGRDACLYMSFSQDAGRTWTPPERTPFETSSTVFDVVTLPDERALLTYGYRLEPFGIRARVLAPDCRDIMASDEVIIREDGLGYDIGYSASAVISDHEVLVVYYYYGADEHRHIAGSICRYE